MIPQLCPVASIPICHQPNRRPVPQLVVVSRSELLGMLALDLLVRHFVTESGMDLVQRLPPKLRPEIEGKIRILF